MARQHSIVGNTDSLRYTSWRLCRLLDKIIGTEEEVALRRKCDAMRYYINNTYESVKILYSGSKGEGFNFESSDVDLMYIFQDFVVLESMSNIMPVDNNKIVLLMRREECTPGFVILQVLKMYNLEEDVVLNYNGHPVVSSLLWRDAQTHPELGQVGHGPCNTSHYIVDVDSACCFECDTWPSEANEFIHRHRPYGWPGKSLLDKIVCRGCHLVPIGDKDSKISPIQWRLSFSAAERDLVHSFNHTQCLVYGLLKIFLQQFVNKFLMIDGILCSYFLKTAMFYCIESTPLLIWREDLLIPCFWFCFSRLITWVEQGYCPNYFVPQNNMFRNKVCGQLRQKLLDVLNRCKRVGWTCIFLCKDIQPLQSVASSLKLINVCDTERECLLDFVTIGLIYYTFFSSDKGRNTAFVHSLTLLSYSRTQQEKDFTMFLLYNVCRCIGGSNHCSGVNTNNKTKYNTLRQRQRLLSTANIGLVGKLDMATYYHQNGQYQKAICLLSSLLSIWKPYVMYLSKQHRVLYHDEVYQRYVCGQGRTLNEKLRFAYIRDISFSKYSVYPAELCHDVDATAPWYVFLPPLPYTTFLLFLCHQKLGNIDKSLSVLHDLEALMRDSVQGYRKYPVVLNMMAICLNKLGNNHGAVEMCLLSQELKPDKNGAARLLDKILSRLY